MAVAAASSARPQLRDEETPELAHRPPRSPQVPEHDRLGQLPPDARSLVEALAVLGSRVPLRMMAATVAGLNEARAAACALDAAMDAGLVSCWPDDPTVPVALSLNPWTEIGPLWWNRRGDVTRVPCQLG